MTIRANHLTLIRVILLPLPYLLVYQGPWSRVAALVIFALLGLTDYLDGLLARRDGSTPLGKLLDPIADKIFISVVMIPLVDLGLLPLWIIWPLFLREFLVTELRRFLTAARRQLPVTELAKIKTTLQMTGGGLILLINTFPKAVTVAFVSGVLLATVFLAVALFWRDGRVSDRMRTALALLAVCLAAAVVFPIPVATLIYGVTLVGVTYASGIPYLWTGFGECVRQRGLAGLIRVLLSAAPPLVALGLVNFKGHNADLVVLILASEFAAQGLDMWAAQAGEADLSGVKVYGLAPAILALAALGILWAGLSSGTVLQVIFLLSVSYALADAWFHRSLLRQGI